MARIRYGISNVYYALATEGTNGAVTYATPVALPGAVAMTMEASGEEVREYADNIIWYAMTANNGYTGTLELEELPDSFRTAVLGDTLDDNGVLWESADSTPNEFALMFQFEIAGDATVSGKRGCFLRCTASRPGMSGNTKEATITPQHDTLNLTAMPRVSDHLVKASVESTSAKYSTWFDAVPTR